MSLTLRFERTPGFTPALTGNHSDCSTDSMTRVKPVPDVKFCLVFQCESLSVPVMRRVLGDTLLGLGVDDDSVYDILLAATEACTNVLHPRRPAGPRLRRRDQRRRGRLPGRGGGLRSAGLPPRAPDAAEAEAEPIRSRRRSPSCPSRAAAWPSCGPAWTTSPWTAVPGRGTVVTMRKHIRWSDGRPAAPAPRRQLDLWLASLPSPPRIACLRADRGHHLSRVAR